MISEVIKAFLEFSDQAAKKVWLMDRQIDEEYLGILRQLLTYMMEEPKRITACTSLLYMVKDLERIGDYGKNMAKRSLVMEPSLITEQGSNSLRRMTKDVILMMNNALDASEAVGSVFEAVSEGES